jgi:hypothetical protein
MQADARELLIVRKEDVTALASMVPRVAAQALRNTSSQVAGAGRAPGARTARRAGRVWGRDPDKAAAFASRQRFAGSTPAPSPMPRRRSQWPTSSAPSPRRPNPCCAASVFGRAPM